MTSATNPHTLLTVREAAAMLGITRNSLYWHHAAGRIPSVRMGRGIRIRRDVVERILREGAPLTGAQPSKTGDDTSVLD
jgi:excisionase family DNA binding protein